MSNFMALHQNPYIKVAAVVRRLIGSGFASHTTCRHLTTCTIWLVSIRCKIYYSMLLVSYISLTFCVWCRKNCQALSFSSLKNKFMFRCYVDWSIWFIWFQAFIQRILNLCTASISMKQEKNQNSKFLLCTY